MRAIILAAGAGTRLQPLTDECPKCLVSLGGRPLLDYQLEALRLVGVEDVVLVVGCKSEQVRAHCGSAVRYIENADFSTTNSIYSLYLAAAEFNTDTFLFNCDILFHKGVLERMLDPAQASVVAVDAQVERVPNEMNVCYGDDMRITAISKSLDPARARAQSVQLAKFDAAGAAQVSAEVVRLVEQDQKDVFPTSAYGPLIDARSLFAVDTSDLAWGEIDSLEDYERARTCVLPALEY